MSSATDRCEVAIVGGGPAGAALAIRLARAGRDVVLFERQPTYRWHAGGVFSGPAAVRELALVGQARLALFRGEGAHLREGGCRRGEERRDEGNCGL